MSIRLLASKHILAKVVFLVLAMMLCADSVATQGTGERKRILLFFTHESHLPAQVGLERAIRSTLENGSPVPVEIYSEYLDAVRTRIEDYEQALANQLQRKYGGKKFDLLVAINPPALKMLLRNQSALFPETPIVFLVLDQGNLSDIKPSPNMTGVWGDSDYGSNLELALSLHPGTKQVAVISGVSEWDKYWMARVQNEFRAFEDKVEFSYLTGLSPPELQKALAALPPQTIVMFVSSVQDNAGNNYGNLEVLRQIAPASSAPVYGISDAQLGLGIVGGKLLSFEALGAGGAQVGLRVLAGEKPEAIPPHGIPSVPMFDWRQLQRWGISEANLPEGSIVQFKQPTVWEEYKWYAIGLIAAVIVETLLIAWLLYLRLRRRQAESEAARLGGRLAEIVANVPGIVWESRTDPGTNRRRTTFISDYVQRMLGYSPEEWLKQPPGFGVQIIPEEERDRVVRESDEVIKTGKEAVSEFRWFAKDGRIRWVENHVAPIIDEEAGIVGLRGVALDVTDRKAALDELLRSEERFGKAFRANPQPMSITTIADGRYIDINDSFLSVSGYTKEEVIGRTTMDLGVWKTPEARAEFVAAIMKNGSVVNFETEFFTKNGTSRRLLTSAERLEIGGDDCLLVASTDITERYAAQQAVRESEARFRNMAETAPVVIWISDESQATTYVNKQWLELTGSTLEQELGLDWSRHVHRDDVESTVQKYTVAFEKRVPFELEFRVRRTDGEYRWVFTTGAPRFSAEGKFLGYIGTAIDISERKQSENDLKQAHDELHILKNKLEAENIYLQEELRQDQAFGDIVGESSAIKYVLFKVSQVAPTDATVLITGETGTGKELVAHAIHNASQRKDRPLIKVNCAALSPSLIESELFGHEKGAFTGAGARKLGRFELANTGTLLLDEIGELPLDLQSKLLRVLQDGEFERVGSGKTIRTDVRILASTNRDLKQALEKGKFREDLWYRLNVFPITTPPLRDRRDDIPLLTEHFARTFARKFGKDLTAISPETLPALCTYSWPGNVRELANVIERAVINLRGTVLRIHEDFLIREADILAASVLTLEDMERDHIRRVLEDLNWRIDGPRGAARVLGINPSTLRTRMGKLGISKPNGRPPGKESRQ